MMTPCSLLLLTLVGGPTEANPPREFCAGDRCADDTLRIVFTDSADVADFDEPTEVANLSSVLKAPPVGTEFTVIVVLNVESEAVQGWTFGVAHDSAVIELREATSRGLDLPGTDSFNSTGPSFGLPSPGFVSFHRTCHNSCFGANALVPLGQNSPIAYARYRVIARLEGETRIAFVDGLIPNEGSPPVAVNFTISHITRPPRHVTDGLVVLRHPFLRSDLNGDEEADLSDLILLVRYLFLGGALAFDCDDMLDVNGDGTIDVSDPTAFINWRFRGTFSLPTPVLACGVGEGAGIGCNESNCPAP